MKEMIKLTLPILRNTISPSNQPYFCTYIITWRCNAHCIMCDIWQKDSGEELNYEQIVGILKKLPMIRAMRITGGEPFLRSDLAAIVDAIDTYTMAEIIHITTNGFMTSAIIDFMQRVKSNKTHIKISLNAIGERYDKIMGVPGAYNKVLKTIDAIKNKVHHKLFAGINQTITDWDSYEDSKEIRKICQENRLAYLPVIAYQKPALYDKGSEKVNQNTNFKTFGNLSSDQIKLMLDDFIFEAKRIKNPVERFVKRYYLRGLYNRLILNKNTPQPRCIALKNHLRLLPNGDVPVCLYNAKIIGNIYQADLPAIWNNQMITDMRQWVARCPGCWAECEVVPNATFSFSTLLTLCNYY